MHLSSASLRIWAALAAIALAFATGCASTGPESLSREEKAELAKDHERRARMHYDIGVNYLSEERTPMAIRQLLQASKFAPRDPAVRVALAEAYRRAGRTAESEEHLLQAIEIKPDLHKARLNLSGLYSQLERFDEAREQAEVLVEDPTFSWPWRAHTNLGWAFLKLGNFAEAEKNLNMALDYRQDYWPARLNLGILKAEKKHHREALAQFRQVLAEKPGPFAESEVHYRLAELHLEMGDNGTAIEHLTASAARLPNGAWGERSAETLRRLQ